MPLLDFDSKSSVVNKFDFLNLNLAARPIEKDDDESSGPQAIRLSNPSDDSALSTDVSSSVVEPRQLRTVLVLKTALRDGRKLFINIVKLADDQPQVNAILRASHIIDTEVWISDMRQDKDKKGSVCLVITALPLHTFAIGQNELKTTALIKSIMGLGFDVLDPTKWSLPKMQKKGELQRIRISKALAGTPPSRKGASNLITELDTTMESVSVLGNKRSLHSISKFPTPVIKTPLPSMFTHQFSLPLESQRRSWSIYFDASDSTLKILVPPSEDFIQIQALSDDFRAFIRNNVLYVFYSG